MGKWSWGLGIVVFSRLLFADPISEELERYEAIRVLKLTHPTKSLKEFTPRQGITVLERDAKGNAVSGELTLLVDNRRPGLSVEFLSDADGWKPHRLVPLADDGIYFRGKIPLRHEMQYGIRIDGGWRFDPASTTYATANHLNSVWWDFDRPGAYRRQTDSVDLRRSYLIYPDTDLYGLGAEWGNGPKQKAETYRYLATSGIAEKLNETSNAVEFLPFHNSVDGDFWHFRYQVYGLYGPDSRYGSPEDFARLVDNFNRAGVGVIMDVVLGHWPHRGNEGIRKLEDVGLVTWLKTNGKLLFGEVDSPWKTKRYDYANCFVRRFLIDSVLFNLKHYAISGIRIDNLDGILFLPGGREFIRELVEEIRAYRPELRIIGEVYWAQKGLLEALDRGGLGVDFKIHAPIFDSVVKDSLTKFTEHVDMEPIRHAIRGPWGWKLAASVHHSSSHDEVANPRPGAAGAYWRTMIGGGEYYIERKTKAYSALPMVTGSAHMFVLQNWLLQSGDFNKRPEVEWRKLEAGGSRNVYGFLSHLSKLLRASPAFNFPNYHPEIENHIDYDNKVVSVYRRDAASNREFYAIINLGHHQHLHHYRFGVKATGKFKIVADSERREFGGAHVLAKLAPSGVLPVEEIGFHSRPRSISLPYLAAYGVVLLEKE